MGVCQVRDVQPQVRRHGGYAEYAFGKSGNFMANYTYGVSLLIANVAIAISAVGYGTELFGATLSPVQIGWPPSACCGSAPWLTLAGRVSPDSSPASPSGA